jgi:uncharacterized protein (DUF1697 family)
LAIPAASDQADPMSVRRVALLRGINVGGHRKVLMAELRTLCTEPVLGVGMTMRNLATVCKLADMA